MVSRAGNAGERRGLRLAEILIACGVAFKNLTIANHGLRSTWFNA